MLRSLYSGVSGMRGFQTKMDVIGNNISNVNTVGFKKSRVMFQDILNQKVGGASAPTDLLGGVNPRQIGLGSTIGSIDVVHSPGSPMTTNLSTDLTIEGDGFFLVSPDGTVENALLTRAGNFTRDAQGNLVNAQGMKVLSSGGGPITISREEYVSFSIGRDGSISMTNAAGETVQGDEPIGMMAVHNPAGLEKVGGSLFRLTTNAMSDGTTIPVPGTPIEGANSYVVSGQLEMSNVDLAEEFTEMIVAQRGFQANSRTITTSDSILEELINLKR